MLPLALEPGALLGSEGGVDGYLAVGGRLPEGATTTAISRAVSARSVVASAGTLNCGAAGPAAYGSCSSGPGARASA